MLPARFTSAVAKEQGTRRRLGRIVFWGWGGICALALIGGAVTAAATARPFTVPSTSMENTVKPGDLVWADRTARVQRGDIIVERQPSAGSGYFIRRVIGLPGDHVVCCDARGRITVSGKPLNETYLYPADAPSATAFNVTVPAGRFWLMGDHRSIALDSRTKGPLAVQVAGRVFYVAGSGKNIFPGTPEAFVAAGLAPAGGRVVPALAGIGVSALAFMLLVGLAIFGVIRWAIRRSARSHGQVAETAPAEDAWGRTR